MIYRTIEKIEYDSLAKIHLLAFKNFFLTTLGYSFLKTYYHAVLKINESIAICAVNEFGEIIGFSTGCALSTGYHKRLLQKNIAAFSQQALRIIFTKPKAILRLLKNLDKNLNIKDDGNYAELLSIAVSPEAKGFGIGKKMIAYFEEVAKSRGCNKIALTTDYSDNDDVIAFYNRSGYKVFYEFTTYPNRKMLKLLKELK